MAAPPWGLHATRSAALDRLLEDIARQAESKGTSWMRVIVKNPEEIPLDIEDAEVEQVTELVDEETTETIGGQDTNDAVQEQPEHIDVSGSHEAAASPAACSSKEDIPYYKRNKRNWEQYIERADSDHGSMTHRRLARELDAQTHKHVEMDYGDDDVEQSSSRVESGRRVVSYEDV